MYRDRLRSALRRKLGTIYRQTLLDSEDAVQDGILAALHSIDDFEYRGRGSFLAWLLRISERQVIERVRALHAQKRDPGRVGEDKIEAVPAKGATASQVAAGAEAEQRLQRCLDRMEPHERDVVVLRRYLGLPFEAISQELHLPTPGAARALLSRAQVRLAIMLEAG